MSDLFDKLAVLHKLEDLVDAENTQHAAQLNGHLCPCPTHKVVKEGQIVGALSMGVVPVVLVWQHTELVTARDSINLLSVTESIMANNFKTWLMPCAKDSPYYGLMPKFGYEKGGDFTLFFKQPRRNPK